MIDLVHNEATGFTFVHDQPGLDGAVSIAVGRNGAGRFLDALGASTPIVKRIPDDLARALRAARSCSIIRMAGSHPVATRTIAVHAS